MVYPPVVRPNSFSFHFFLAIFTLQMSNLLFYPTFLSITACSIFWRPLVQYWWEPNVQCSGNRLFNINENHSSMFWEPLVQYSNDGLKSLYLISFWVRAITVANDTRYSNIPWNIPKPGIYWNPQIQCLWRIQFRFNVLFLEKMAWGTFLCVFTGRFWGFTVVVSTTTFFITLQFLLWRLSSYELVNM